MPLKSNIRLQPHQQQALSRTNTDGQILNWGLGSGKTLGAIAMAERRGGKVLVVTPASLRTNFKEQLTRFIPKNRVQDYTIVSYEKFKKNPRGLVTQLRPQTLIADEMHRLRNPKPRAPFEEVRQQVPFMIGLTGSLINNRPEEVVPLTNLVAGKKVFKSVEDFQDRHIQQTKVQPGIWGRLMGAKPGISESIKNAPEFNHKISPHVHRFTGSPEYKKHVPKILEEKVEVVMTPQQESMYKSLSTRNPVLAYKMRHNLPPSKKELKQMNAFLTAARQIMNNPTEYTVKETPDVIGGSPKFQQMIADVKKQSDKDKNFRGVIYSNFLSSGVEPVVTELNRQGVKSETFTGKLNDKQRQAVVDNLNKGRTKVVGLSPAGGEGLDLKGVRLVQLTEEHWNPERGQQAIGRSARYKSHEHLPEAQRQVIVRRYLAKHRPTLMNRVFGTKRDMSADEWIDQRRQEKLQLNQEFLKAMEKSASFQIGILAALEKEAASISALQQGYKRLGAIKPKINNPKQVYQNIQKGLEGQKPLKLGLKETAMMGGSVATVPPKHLVDQLTKQQQAAQRRTMILQGYSRPQIRGAQEYIQQANKNVTPMAYGKKPTLLIGKGKISPSYVFSKMTDQKLTPQGKKGINVAAAMHEQFERAAMKNKRPVQYGYGHASPEVLAKEHNMLAKLTGPGAKETQQAMTKVREMSGDSAALNRLLKKRFGERAAIEYGKGQKIPKAMRKALREGKISKEWQRMPGA